MKKTICRIALVAMLLTILGAAANAGMLIPSSDQAKIHSQAPEHSPVITETEGGEWDLERVDFVHYAKPDNPGKPGGGGHGGGDTNCYKLMGVQWKSLPVNYVINPANQDGLSADFVTSTLSTSVETWDAATTAELFNDAYGVGAVQYGVQDYVNAVAFGTYPDPNVIGVTSVWYTRRGKQIVEFDMLLNDSFTWGDAAANPLLMDMQNIATHEFGHSVGMGDIYTSTCSDVTMYGYSGEGETSKRTLEPDDILGLQKMYQ